MAPKLNQYLSRSNRKFNYVLFDVMRICLSLFKATRTPSSSLPSSDENFEVDELVSRSEGFEIGNLIYMAMDDFNFFAMD